MIPKKTGYFIALTIALGATATPVSSSPNHAGARFDEMKMLAGVWRQSDKPDSLLRIRFSLTAGDSVLVEEWLRGTKTHSLTLYHRDRGRLIATHYCPQGNQPRLAMQPPSEDKIVRFVFRDATDLDVKRESYLVALGFDLSRQDVIVRSETYRQAGKEELSVMRLVRDQ